MAKAVKLADIGERLGVSTVTVSKALSGQKGVSDQMRKKIIRLADEMGYVKSAPEERRAARESFTIGVIVAERYLQENQSYYWMLYQEISIKAIENNCFPVLEVVGQDAEEHEEFPKVVTEKKADGLIILGAFKAEYAKYLIRNAGMPMLNLDTTGGWELCDCVISNNMMGGYRMTSYLLELGHEKIGFVGTRLATSSIDDRYLGYLKALMEHGIAWRKDWVIDDRGLENGKIDSILKFALPQDMPTAFFCNCDLSAALLIKKLAAAGYRVPEDISVVGFDNYVTEHFAGVGITTYETEAKRMAERAVFLILEKCRDAGRGTDRDEAFGRAPETVMFAGKLIERDSAARIGPPVPFA